MKNLVKIMGWIMAGISVLIVVYFSLDILKARQQTPRLMKEFQQTGYPKLALSDLSDWQLKALLAVEDPGFYTHHGIDLKTPGAGLTTITQSLAKMLYFHPFKPGIRKIRLMLLAALVVDPLVPKDEQLVLFLNRIYLGKVKGRPIIGFAAAADAYYHKTLQQLTEYEYLALVAMIIAPNNFHLLDQPAANAERTRRLQKVVSGAYQPKNVMDIYYGPLPAETQKGLAPASYFPGLYSKEKP